MSTASSAIRVDGLVGCTVEGGLLLLDVGAHGPDGLTPTARLAIPAKDAEAVMLALSKASSEYARSYAAGLL